MYIITQKIMKKKTITIDYQKLLIKTVKEKYFNLALGMLVAFVISSAAYKFLLKNIHLNLAFSLPKINFQTKKKVVKKVLPKPVTYKATYVIQEGDDLWHIAEKFYGSGFNAFDISVANKINDPSSLNAGQKLLIPEVTPRQPTVGDISAASTNQVIYTEGKYVVQPGDSLSIIAQKVYGDIDAWPRILQANRLSSPDKIEVGMVLTIPR